MKILIVDDEQTALRSLTRILRRYGLRDVEVCDNGNEAIRRIEEKKFDIVLLDLIMPGLDGLQVLETAKPSRPSTEFIMLTAMDDVASAVKAIRLGAFDYLVKPVENERLHLTIQRAYERKGLLGGLLGRSAMSEEPRAMEGFSRIVTQDLKMKELISFAFTMTRSGNPILITGESGTGKELFAQGIHAAGPNPNGPFTAVNVAGVPEALFEGEFFGHTRGAFTGADQDHPGYFERSDRGTLFLDEVGELPLKLQAKFLRVLEDKCVSKLGAVEPVEVNARIVSATNRDLDAACRDGRFRLDLLYRLRSVHIHLPPLRERRDDIPLLSTHYLKQSCARHKKEISGIGPEATEILLHKDYPGNVRELAQLMDMAVLLCDSEYILPKHLGEERSALTLSVRAPCTFKENDEIHLAYVLNHTRGDNKQTAKILGVTVRQIQRRVLQMKEDPRWTKFMEGLEIHD